MANTTDRLIFEITVGKSFNGGQHAGFAIRNLGSSFSAEIERRYRSLRNGVANLQELKRAAGTFQEAVDQWEAWEEKEKESKQREQTREQAKEQAR